MLIIVREKGMLICQGLVVVVILAFGRTPGFLGRRVFELVPWSR